MSDTDRELLELAAVAYWGAPCPLEFDDKGEPCYWIEWRGLPQKEHWNPLADDGDALRLAVALAMDVCVSDEKGCERTAIMVWCYTASEWVEVTEPHAGDPCAATRRAIVRAAAEIGRQMRRQHE